MSDSTNIAHEVAEAMARGEEHLARDRFGDAAVDAAIRATLEAEGYDFDACVQHANGFDGLAAGQPIP